MSHPSRQQRSRPAAPQRRLSIEDTYSLATVARRKSSSEATRNDLRLRVGHAFMLEALENAIRNSPPPSPKQSSLQPVRSDRHITWAAPHSLPPKRLANEPIATDEYGFDYDDGEEDLGGLSLTRTSSRRP